MATTRAIEALFPGYFFARSDWQPLFREIYSSPSVAGLAHFGDQPHESVIPYAVIASLRASLAESGMAIVSTKPTPSPEVTIVARALHGWTALVTQYSRRRNEFVSF